MSHKTNNSYHLRDLLQPLQVGKTAEVPVIDVKSSAGKSWKRRRYNALFMSRQKKFKDKDKRQTGTGIILSEANFQH